MESASQWWVNDDWDKGPHHDPSLGHTELNVSAIVGDTVVLPCQVFHLNDKTVISMSSH